jgi:hypothetical protein
MAEERFDRMRKVAANRPLNQDEVTELFAIVQDLIDERLQVRQHLDRLRYDFKNDRAGLNRLDESVQVKRAPAAKRGR